MEVEINFEDQRWAEANLAALAAESARAVFAYFEIGDEWNVSILACDDDRIATLNADFRQKPQPTNVLAWPSEERGSGVPGKRPDAPDPDEPELGDIAISYDTMAREASDGRITLADHTRHLIVHALLHCLGYDHIHDTDAELMEATEVEILARMGVANPY